MSYIFRERRVGKKGDPDLSGVFWFYAVDTPLSFHWTLDVRGDTRVGFLESSFFPDLGTDKRIKISF